MTDISMLLKEAKPLYLKRKKQRQVIKNAVVGMSMCFLLIGLTVHNFSNIGIRNDVNDLYVCLYDEADYESRFDLKIASDDFYPVDEYGLILVNA